MPSPIPILALGPYPVLESPAPQGGAIYIEKILFPRNPPLPGSSFPVIAEHYGISIRTLYNDFSSGLGLCPRLSPLLLDEVLLSELHQVRQWCSLYRKFSYFTYRNFLLEKTAGTVSQTLNSYQAYFSYKP